MMVPAPRRIVEVRAARYASNGIGLGEIVYSIAWCSPIHTVPNPPASAISVSSVRSSNSWRWLTLSSQRSMWTNRENLTAKPRISFRWRPLTAGVVWSGRGVRLVPHDGGVRHDLAGRRGDVVPHGELGAHPVLLLDQIDDPAVLGARPAQPTGVLHRAEDHPVVRELVHQAGVVLGELQVVAAGDDRVVELVDERGVGVGVAARGRLARPLEVRLEDLELGHLPPPGHQPGGQTLEDLLDLEHL